ncbi:OmpL47-type beta-barrel domain-containing protein [Paenibacillus sp. LHD-38]|uniref:OmpL47-type beta-barrel domain-containing protein n=1 Tax=Paenibacillus sp. LHD-38 TaxID=3072143 RepID=UPI00281086F2|nr:carboxypeptidase regulatory-like domain-containing protein [Paenibacillus sp. LHD-38]MDQ8737929.1 carboxypeptidase regulatory-like domain-containing protein [Paenibacillus sp. LHD-38]
MKKTNGSRTKVLALILFLFVTFMTTDSSIMYADEGDNVPRSLQGKITDENGNPIDGASIQIGTYAPGFGFRFVGSAVTNEEGNYDIPSYTRNFGDAVSTIITANGNIVINALTSSETFNYQFPVQRATLTGKVTYGDMYETPVAGYQVDLSVHLGSGGRRINVASATTDAEGNYTFSIIPGDFSSALGENMFRVTFDDNYERYVELHLGDNKSEQAYGIPIPQGVKLNGRFVGYVTDEHDAPLYDAAVDLVESDTNIFSSDGYYFTEIIKGGNYTVRVSAPGFTLVEETIEINGGDSFLTFKLTKSNPPVVTATADRTPDHQSWYNHDVTVSFQATDDDSILAIDPPVIVSTEGVDQVIEGVAKDTAGLTGIGSITIDLDKTPPVTQALVSESVRNNWYNTDVHVTLSSNDKLSGVENTEYSLDNGHTWSDYNGIITIFKEGKNILLYRSSDKAGNTEQSKALEVNIDKTAPSLNVTLDKTVLSPANHKMVSIQAAVNVIESGSGLDSVVLTSITSNETSNQSGAGNTAIDVQNADLGTSDTTFDLRAERSGRGEGRVYTITYTATDMAGNSAVDTATVTVPKKK